MEKNPANIKRNAECNPPIYVIHGEERREYKKHLSILKHCYKNFWRYEDVDRVYGGGISDIEYEHIIRRMEDEIQLVEEMLNKKI